MADFFDTAYLVRVQAGPGALIHAGAPSAGANAIRFTGVTGGGEGNTTFGVSSRPEFAFPGDFHIEGLIQFDSGTVGSTVLIFCHIGGTQFAITRETSGFIQLRANGTGTTRITGSTAMAVNTLHAWALTRVSGVWTLRLNGVSQGTYTDSSSIPAQAIFLGSSGVISGVGNLTGYMDEVAIYRSGVVTADYTPTYGEVPVGPISNPNWESIVLLLQGGFPATPPTLLNPLGSLQAFPPTWPAQPKVLPGAERVLRVDWGGKGRVRGTVKILGTPDAPVRRAVRLVRELDGVCVAQVISDPVTGAYEFSGFDPLQKYTVLAYDLPGGFRAAIASGVTAEPMV